MATFAIDGALIVVCSIIMYFALPFNGKSVKKILCCLVTVVPELGDFFKFHGSSLLES